jgi:hypothetical protein
MANVVHEEFDDIWIGSHHDLVEVFHIILAFMAFVSGILKRNLFNDKCPNKDICLQKSHFHCHFLVGKS